MGLSPKDAASGKQSAQRPASKEQLAAKEKDKQQTSALQRVSRLGICFTLAWAFLINAAGSNDLSMQDSWQVSYLALACSVVAFGFIARSKPGFIESRAACCAFALLGAAFSVLLVASYAIPSISIVRYPACLACSCVLGWTYLQWGGFYTRINLKNAIACLFLGNIVASLLKCIAHFSPLAITCAITAAMPIFSVLTCRYALSGLPAASPTVLRFDSHNLKALWKAALAACVLSFVTAFLVGASLGNQSAVSFDVFLLGRVFEVVVSAIVLAVVIGLGKCFNYAQLWRILLIILALDVLCQAVLPQITALRCVESSAWNLLVLFIWLTAVDIARHSKASRYIVIGACWAIYAASFAIGSIASSAFALTPGDAVFTTILMFVLTLVGTFCIEVRDQDTKWIFAELSGEPTKAPDDHYSIDERCDEIGKQGSLTPREIEVMKMLCRGRTKSYIAETLYLTENTVRTHTKHIYTKLDVHSKQELMTLVGA